ncbi:PfkB family carbohydrate kinase [Robertmurraya sp.]|uniref:PfkB family carbohydrate kinase n=1 Tax=Robertmurraya sp. TaxID=2837525 RepID=UPI0037038FBB
MRVIGLGDNVVDKYIYSKKMFPGGNCVNFAAHARNIGISSAYMGVFGSGQEGNFVKDILSDLGIDLSHSTQYEGENGITEVDLVNGDRVLLSWNNGGISKEYPINLNLKDLEYLNQFNLIHSSCYSPLSVMELKKLRSLKTLLSFDFAEEEIYREENYLKSVCENIDFAQFSGSHMPEKEIDSLVEKVSSYGVSYIMITQGIKGSTFYDGSMYYKGRAELIDPIDTMGCGDAYITAFLIHLLQNGWSKQNKPSPNTIQEGLQLAARYAAQNCLVEGGFGYGKVYA